MGVVTNQTGSLQRLTNPDGTTTEVPAGAAVTLPDAECTTLLAGNAGWVAGDSHTASLSPSQLASVQPLGGYAGAWSAAYTYAQGAVVVFQGADYLALSPNTAAQPDLNPSVWHRTVVTRTPVLSGDMVVGGDSVVNGGGSGAAASHQHGREWHSWAAVLAGGRIRWQGKFGTSGLELKDIVSATYLGAALTAAPPGATIVLQGGTNDAGNGQSFSVSRAALDSGIAQIQNTGHPLVLVTPPPRTGALGSQRLALAKIIDYMKRVGEEQGIPVYDAYADAVDPSNGNYLATYGNADNVHPNGPGAKAMGQGFANFVADYIPKGRPLLIDDSADTSWLLSNGLLYTDTNADGIPDNWTLSSGAATYAWVTDATVKNRYWAITRNGTDVRFTSAQQTVTPGDVIRLGVRLGADLNATAANISIQLTDATWAVDLGMLDTFDQDIPNGSLYLSQPITIPNGTTAVIIHLRLKAGNGTLRVGEISLIDETARSLVP